MPAIEFSRLRTKIELLGKKYDQPEQFVKDLSDLYFFYSDLTFQSSSTTRVSSTFSAYRAPVMINRELERAFKPMARSRSQETLAIIDALWATRTEEPCRLAAALLGDLPIEYHEAVQERIRNWSQTGDNPELVNALHEKGAETIRRENPEVWIHTLKNWYDSQQPVLQKLAITGLAPMVNDPDFTNLPILFGFLEPIISKADSHLAYTLLLMVEKLAAKSESETVYFLKQIIRESPSKDLPRFIRRALPSFSEQAQLSLKTCLRENTQI